MRLSRKLICGMLVLSCLLLGGCDKVKELTDEEEEIITLYAAKVVAKHNVRLGQGIMRYRAVEEDGQDAEEGNGEAGSDSADSTQTQDQETSSESQEVSGQTDTSGEEASGAETGSISGPRGLAKALGLSNVKFAYKGVYVPDSLRLSDYYTLQDPMPGNQYVIASYQIRNPATTSQTVSVADLRPKFKATLNGQEKDASVVLEGDLSTFEGTLDPGASEDLILLFEFPKEATQNLSDFALTVEANGTTSRLKTRVR